MVKSFIQCYVEILILKQKSEALKNQIEVMKMEQLKYQNQVDELQEKLSNEYEKYRDQVGPSCYRMSQNLTNSMTNK